MKISYQLKLVLFAVVLPCILCSGDEPTPDPLCEGVTCEEGKECRAIKQCASHEDCDIKTVCTSGIDDMGSSCIVGKPLLHSIGGSHEIIPCFHKAPCPKGSFCSAIVGDASSVCCRSQLVVVREGSCPAVPASYDTTMCVDQCESDGDCDNDQKCCSTGCSKECVFMPSTTPKPPPKNDPHLKEYCKKDCPEGQHCRLWKACEELEDCKVHEICTDIDNPVWYRCRFGFQVLTDNVDGSKRDLKCYPGAQCPDGHYCTSDGDDDIEDVCCMSDPDKTTRDGTCSASDTELNSAYCVDECNYDGDCEEGQKCCDAGCSRKCLGATYAPRVARHADDYNETTTTTEEPSTRDVCQFVECPLYKYCRKRGQPCRNNGVYDLCFPEGFCNPCPHYMNFAASRYREYRFDSDGCPKRDNDDDVIPPYTEEHINSVLGGLFGKEYGY